MKIEIKELKKALSFLEKNGNPVDVDIEFDHQGHFLIKSYTDIAGQVVITLYSSESSKFAEVTKSERL